MQRTFACRFELLARAERRAAASISRGHIYWILSNPIYVGRLRHKGQIHDGLHDAIVDQETWDRVQRRLADQTQHEGGSRIAMRSPFSQASSTTTGAIGWDQAMPPKADGVGATTFRERSSRAASSDAGSITRVPAAQIEKQVFDAVQSVIASRRSIESFGAPSRFLVFRADD